MDLPQVGSPSHVPNINDSLSTLAGDDYTQLDGVQVTFDPGVFTQTVTLNTLTDVPAEGNEDLTASLTVSDTRVTVFNPQATVTITEDCRKTLRKLCNRIIRSIFYLHTVVPTISFSTENVVVGEGDGSAEVCLQLSVPLVTDLQVSVTAASGTGEQLSLKPLTASSLFFSKATSGDDFVADTRVASFAAGMTEACVEFPVIDDSLEEDDETFTATFVPPAGGILTGTPATSTVTIIDNDGNNWWYNLRG